MSELLRLSDEQAQAAAAYNAARLEAEGNKIIPKSVALSAWILGWGSPAMAQGIAESQRIIGAEPDGKWGPASELAAEKYGIHIAKHSLHAFAEGPDHLPPGSDDLRKYMDRAREFLGKGAVTDAEFDAWSYIVDRESGGWVGRPNYTANDVARYRDHRPYPNKPVEHPDNFLTWDLFCDDVEQGKALSFGLRSTACCLGQLLGSNWDRYCPVGRRGIGFPVASLAAMEAYCVGRYGGVIQAAEFYDLDRCPEDRKSYYSARALVIGCKPGEGY